MNPIPGHGIRFTHAVAALEFVEYQAHNHPGKASGDEEDPAEQGIFDGIIRSLTVHGDYWMIVADFRSYVEAQLEAAAAFRDEERWTRMSILNCATSGKFSSDRTIEEYNAGIWHLTPISAARGGKCA